jgi:hypothetical protein
MLYPFVVQAIHGVTKLGDVSGWPAPFGAARVELESSVLAPAPFQHGLAAGIPGSLLPVSASLAPRCGRPRHRLILPRAPWPL